MVPVVPLVPEPKIPVCSQKTGEARHKVSLCQKVVQVRPPRFDVGHEFRERALGFKGALSCLGFILACLIPLQHPSL